MSLEQSLARAKSMEASGEGSHHWWRQRISALVLVPMTAWFLFSVVGRLDDTHRAVLDWIAEPVTALCLVVYSIFMFYHAQLGIQVVVEDYVHSRSARTALMLLSKTTFLACGALAVFSVLRIAL
ncbi:MAG: succinate dehydrogenase, hydrophobic membrane anchor protein [Gammaproteobacteria bacterium]|nr:succinate dehydrogenase, hydrophobic membrane anchor protein [Gammaproteobacteria bacterium]MYD75352.1 succinate dehydrogenase, hydrophobic membrane anchor protein [Gammaproteobacteria bacterium]MYJ52984.1 succinate dehydrogenase, hydrophobic membrane anchor protein [Gammaproteobacteria bacterium]